MSRVRVTVNYVDVAISIGKAKKALEQLEDIMDSYTKQHDAEFLNSEGEPIKKEN